MFVKAKMKGKNGARSLFLEFIRRSITDDGSGCSVSEAIWKLR